MTVETDPDRAVVTAQVGRAPRRPWRVGSRCTFGYPTTIVSPAVLEDGSRFPTFAWLTCPWLTERVSAEESAGATHLWSELVSAQPALAALLADVDDEVRAARARESGGVDACEGVGTAGQRDSLAIKCLHAHLALTLAGIDDPIGQTLIAEHGECPDARCERLDRSTCE